jgi:hypothetical protein
MTRLLAAGALLTALLFPRHVRAEDGPDESPTAIGEPAWCVLVDADADPPIIHCVIGDVETSGVLVTPTPAPTPEPEPTATTNPLYACGTDVPALIHCAALRYGVDEARMVRIAKCESDEGANVRAYAPWAPQRGIFQVDRATWYENAPKAGVTADWSAAFDDALNVTVAASMMARGEYWRWTCK